MSVVALVLGAGRGERLAADAPKALVRAAGRTLVAWSAEALGRASGIDALLCVLPAGAALEEGWTAPAELLPAVTGGETRQRSLERGLTALARSRPDAEWVLVHDAARCLVQAEDAEAVLEAARPTGAAVPVVPATDTVKEVAEGAVVRTLERSRLALAQTPQAFRFALLREAVEKARRDGFQGTDCASLVERLGVQVRTCPGRPGNWKVTTPEDLERAEARLRARGGGA
jgi:2-C-methyl-D-erythritol 4-phosphate cytidylyltransferase/2-C-methyl-D-erythritol 2,4-cyclodiphosphate synthase